MISCRSTLNDPWLFFFGKNKSRVSLVYVFIFYISYFQNFMKKIVKTIKFLVFAFQPFFEKKKSLKKVFSVHS